MVGEMMELIGSPIWPLQSVVPRPADIAIPISSPAVRPYAEALCQRQYGGGVKRGIGEIYAPICRKVDSYQLLNIPVDGLDTAQLLLSRHSRPSLVELNTCSMFYDNVFAADGVGGIVVPVKDIWDWDTYFRLY